MFRKPKKKPTALRSKLSATGNGAGGAPEGALGTHLSSSTNDDAVMSASTTKAGKKRRRAVRRHSSSSSEGDNDDGEEGTSDLLQQIRREREDNAKSKRSSANNAPLLNITSTSTTKKKKSKDGGGGSGANWMHQYKSNNDGQMSAQDMATRTAEYHPTENKDADDDKNKTGDKAQNAQIAALQKQPRNKFLAGPLRATTFVRTTARFDYQPDVCKDYKETGFCGFGDTCIYLHDRGDTKTGWQMEMEYEEKKKRDEERKSQEMERFMNSMMCGEIKNNGVSSSSRGDGDEEGAKPSDDGIPFACHICRGPFFNPIVTTCGHYFCEKCLLNQIKEAGSGCPICQKDTHGVMNRAQKLVAKKRRLVGRDGTWEEYLEKSRRVDGDDE